jgi:ATP-binding cassette, subfamily B, bacterial
MPVELTQSLSQFIIKLIKPYKGLLFIMGLMGVCSAFINTFLPYILKLVIDNIINFSGDKTVLLQTTRFYIATYIALWLGICINMRLLDWTRLKLFSQLREHIGINMFSYLQQHSYQYFQNLLAGSLVNKLIDMQNGIIEMLTTLDDLYAQAFGLSIAIITLLFVHPIFSIILSGWALAFLLITFLFLKPIQQLSRVFAESKTTVVGNMVDSINNILGVKLFAKYAEENQYVSQSIKKASMNDRAMQIKIIKMRILWDISIILLMSLNLFILFHLYSKNLITVGDFTFVISLSISVLWSLWFVSSKFVSFFENIGRCKQAFSIIYQPHDIVDSPEAKSLIIQSGEIRFHDVTFHYDQGTKLFKNKNIVISGGQKVGLVGFSGSGKSTFVNLILRLFEVKSGKITIDNQDINGVTQQSLREQIALVPQDITLFHRTLMENIQFSNTDATELTVIETAKQAHCHEFINQLRDNYQSLVGERGVKLSGGQRQRIAVARAMLKNAPILILDEATSSLDSINEKYIQEELDMLMKEKTTIIIAHRISTLAKMDRILVFEKGEIIEDGTHDILLAQGGHYAKMWYMQSGRFLPNKEVKIND